MRTIGPALWLLASFAAVVGCDAQPSGAQSIAPGPMGHGGDACGAFATECACVDGFGTDHFPGQRVPMVACASGVAELASCQAACGGYVSSAARCVCDGPGPGLADPRGDACARSVIRPWAGQVACEPLSAFERELFDRLTTFWHTAPSAACRYDADRGHSGPCGPLNAGNAFYCPADDSIQYDGRFFDDQRARHGDAAAATVIAHEWGHLQQRRLGYDVGGYGVDDELHADCQAGLFIAGLERALGEAAVDVDGAVVSLCEGADAATHGSCVDRAGAFQHGRARADARLPELCGPNPVGAMVAVCGAP